MTFVHCTLAHLLTIRTGRNTLRRLTVPLSEVFKVLHLKLSVDIMPQIMARRNARTHLFSVALDFGTTFSGLAFSTVNDFQKRPDIVHAFTQWNAGGQCLISNKTPTCLLLTAKKEFEAFGYEAENKYADLALDDLHSDRYFFRRYKMKLHGHEKIKENEQIKDESGKPLPAILVFSLSIKYLKDKFSEILEKQGLNIKEEEILWTLTVPAIWSESAKSFMRKAGVQAGIKSEHLKLALEPEAASLWCQHVPIERKESELSVADIGTKYMIIDLGGGTVDITVHEKVSDGKLKEIYQASGGPWGGTAVDEGFLQLLIKIVGGPVINIFRKEHTADYLDFMREFEISKRTLAPDNKLSFKVRLPPIISELCQNETGESLENLITTQNSPYKGKLKILGDKLVIDRDLMINIFMDVEEKIIDHVKGILGKPTVEKIDLILLVGGFAESPMIQHFLKQHFETKSRRVIVPQDAGLSVVKGAVIYGHVPLTIESRVVLYTYGYDAMVPFDSRIHPESKKTTNCKGEPRCRDSFLTFVTAGTSVRAGDFVKKEVNLNCREVGELNLYYTEHSDVMFSDDIRLRRLFHVQLSDILPENAESNQTMIYQFSFGETEVETEVQLPKMKFRKKISYKFKLE
ncbi:hypothetical protein FSP39_008563 [Pinctada imbricata]|uniref:Uncharacterized protein n=1 Tax=Pinctada imbricata TaxID=66713 RepID=A0AA88XHM0_PINIB|nr:hypothetical protein FSP39_008563 [Pinctada imbricata]